MRSQSQARVELLTDESHPASSPRAVACLLTLLGAAMLAGGCATSRKEPLLTAEQRAQNLESFDYVWTTVRRKHWDPALGGVDWDGWRDELRPRVEQAEVRSQALRAMAELLDRLGQSHFAIIPSEAYAALDDPDGGPRDGATGIDVRVIDGEALVASVETASPAAEAGVRPGWVIVRIGDGDVAPRLKRLAKKYEGETYHDFVLASVVIRRMSGRIGDPVRVRFLDESDRVVDLEIERVAKRGRSYRLGHLPPIHVWYESKRLDRNIGYFAFNGFFDPVRLMPAFGEAIQSFQDADGIIIDVRGNPGGIGAMAMGMAGWLVAEKDQYLGTMYARNTKLKLVVNPRSRAYDGPVAILVDGLSVSSSEFFAGGLQGIGRARVFGSRTAGAALPSQIEKLPNGDGFQYATANYIAAGGVTLEGNGVTPDVEIAPTRAALLAGADPALETAVAWIHEQTNEH